MLILLLLILAVLLFGPAKVKAWAGGAFVLVLVVLAFTSDGVLSTMFGNIWLWVILIGGAGLAAMLRLTGESWRDVLTGQRKR